MADQDPIQEFLNCTGTTNVARAEQYLKMADQEVETAIVLYRSEEDRYKEKVKPAQSQWSSPLQTSSTRSRDQPGRMMTLSEMNQHQASDDDDDDSRPNYYAGGSVGHGVQLQGPEKRQTSSTNKIIQNVFENARRLVSTTQVDEEKDNQHFSGSGYRLGDTNFTPGLQPTVQPKSDQSGKHATITFYQNGFVVDDGPIRDYTDPENSRFLQDINHGYVPSELEAQAGRGQVHMSLVNKEDQVYSKPDRPSMVTFSGSGARVDSSSTDSGHSFTQYSTVHFTSHTINHSQSSFEGTFSTKPPVIDESKPITQVQIIFHDGKRKAIKLNAEHTILDLRNWINLQGSPLTSYRLLTVYPSKVLTDLNQTIEQAGLCNSSVMQRP